MAIYQVQAGDNLSTIAKRFGVDAKAITGYRSNDPNVIFPGENLTINIPANIVPDAPVAPTAPVAGPQITEDGTALVAPSGPGAGPAAPVAPGTPAGPESAPTAPPAAAPSPTGATADPSVPVEPARTFETPTGAVVDDKGTVVAPPMEQGLDSLLQDLADSNPELADQVMNALGYSNAPEKRLESYGLNGKLVEQGFEQNPTQTLSALIKQVMDATGLPDVRANITSMSKEIEDMENARDDEIRKVNDDPFASADSKSKAAKVITDKYESRIANRVNRLTLLQNAYQDARQEAQFAATTAIGLYDKERTLQASSIEKELDRAEKRAEAERKQNEKDYQVVTLKDEFGNEYTRIFDKKTGTFTSGGSSSKASIPGSSSSLVSAPTLSKTEQGQVQSLVQVGKSLASSFGSKFQQTQYLKSLNDFAARGDTQGLSEFIFGRAIDTLPDADERKKVRGRYEMVKRLNRIQDLLTSYEQAGGKTGFFKGSIQSIKERFGQEGDASLASIGTAIANSLDELVRFRTGAALTTSEEAFYKKILPGTLKSAALNEANLTGLRDSLAYDVDNAMRLQLTSGGYDSLNESLAGSPVSPGGEQTTSAPILAKGELSDRDFVEQALKKQGLRYMSVITKVPKGKIGVILNSTGQVGAIAAGEYNPSLYTKL